VENYKNQAFLTRLRCALQGLRAAVRAETSLKQQLLAFAAVAGVLLWLRPRPVWWALALLASGAVIAAELLNTAIEQLADALHPEQSGAIRTVKDCAAAGVLVAVIAALGVALAFIVHLLRAHGASPYDS
jgi:undecaprenol kinase